MGALWTRRGAGLAGLAAAMGPAMSALAAADPLSGESLYADLKTYAGFGDHRTGTAGDEAVTAWLERELRAAGYAVERQAFEVPVFDLTAAEVWLGEQRLDAFPIWAPRPGEASRPLSLTPRRGDVAVLSFPYGTGAALGVSDAYRKPIQAAIDAGAAGVVAITENPLGELVAYNTPPEAGPWAVPVLGVAGRDGPALVAAARAAAPARLRIAGTPKTGRAENVVASRQGRGKPLLVSTPKSGWFHCAGERGSGLAIWLGLARHLAGSGRSLVFMSASGHELDGYGGHMFAHGRAPTPADSAGWVHIGANVAAYDFALRDGRIIRQDGPQAGRRLAVSDSLLSAARAAFAGQPSYEAPLDIDIQSAPGEIAEYQRLGYAPLVGMVGLHPLHHTRRDLPDVTGPELLEPVARGLAAVIDALPA